MNIIMGEMSKTDTEVCFLLESNQICPFTHIHCVATWRYMHKPAPLVHGKDTPELRPKLNSEKCNLPRSALTPLDLSYVTLDTYNCVWYIHSYHSLVPTKITKYRQHRNKPI